MDLVVSLLLGLDRPITSPQVISFYHLVITIIVNNYKGSHSIPKLFEIVFILWSGGDVNGLLLARGRLG